MPRPGYKLEERISFFNGVEKHTWREIPDHSEGSLLIWVAGILFALFVGATVLKQQPAAQNAPTATAQLP